MRGRKRIPTDTLKLVGTYRPHRHDKERAGEPVAKGELADTAAPEWLTDSQKSGWQWVMTHAPQGLLKQIDRGMLVVWVIAEDDHYRASNKQNELDSRSSLPMLSPSKNGPQVSPYQTIKVKSALLMMKAASELGFSPTARPRLSTGASDSGPSDSPWAKFSVLPGGKSVG